MCQGFCNLVQGKQYLWHAEGLSPGVADNQRQGRQYFPQVAARQDRPRVTSVLFSHGPLWGPGPPGKFGPGLADYSPAIRLERVRTTHIGTPLIATLAIARKVTWPLTAAWLGN